MDKTSDGRPAIPGLSRRRLLGSGLAAGAAALSELAPAFIKKPTLPTSANPRRPS